MAAIVPIFFIQRLASTYKGLSEREEKNEGCHFKKLVMTS
jgi:hypothetical protein